MISTSQHNMISASPRVMVVDGSRLARRLIADVLRSELPDVEVIACEGVAQARAELARGAMDMVTTSLVLPDGDGATVARSVREAAGQSYVPVVVVSGQTQVQLEARNISADITDYFDKGLGQHALATFIRGYVHPQPIAGARVLYVEDSRTVAAATARMLRAQGLEVTLVATAEDALEYLHDHRPRLDYETSQLAGNDYGTDLLLTDVYLNGALSGRDLVSQVRAAFGYDKRMLPIVVMTGDENRDNQSVLLREGANDLVLKPIEERLLVTKVLFQLRAAQLPEQKSLDG